MNRTLFFLAFALFAGRVFSQNLDSLAATKQVDSLLNLNKSLVGQGRFEEALQFVEQAEQLCAQRLGNSGATYGWCLHNHGRTFFLWGKFNEAAAFYLKALSLWEKVSGKEQADYATSLGGLASVYDRQGNSEKAEPLYLEAIAIQEKMLDKGQVNYAASLNNLGNLYDNQGKPEKAEPLFLRAIEIWGKALGKEHSYYAAGLTNLALVYYRQGQYEKAEPLYLEALAVRKKALGEDNQNYAALLFNLGLFYHDTGDYEKAEPLYLEAMSIYGKIMGRGDPAYGECLNNLANLYSLMGIYEKAEPLQIEALAIRKKSKEEENSEYAPSLNNLGAMYTLMGQFEKAEPFLLEAKALFEKTLPDEAPNYANSLDNLAQLYTALGLLEKAEPFALEAVAIKEKALGKQHPEYATGLSNLGIFYFEVGNYQKAEPLLLEALAIRENALGKANPDYAENEYNLAALYLTMSDFEKAERFVGESVELEQLLAARASHHLSEQELAAHLKNYSNRQNLALSLAQLAERETFPQVCFDNALFYKGFLLQAAGQIKRLAQADSAASEKFIQLKGCERLLAQQYALPLAERDSTQVADLETKAINLEKDLARTVTGFGTATRQVKWRDVQAALRPGEAAVEFVNYRFLRKKETDSTMYAALLLRPGMEQPKFIPLFEEKQLDALLQRSNDRKEAYVKQLYSLADRGVVAAGQPQKSLAQLIWQPLETALAGVQTVYLSPSGLLHRLNFSAIPISPDSTLADRYNLVELGSTRQLVIPQQVEIKNNEAQLFGGIQYNMDSTAIFGANTQLDSTAIASRGELSFAYTDSTLRSGSWNYLPGTEKEIAALEKTMQTAGLKTETRRGWAATEEAFKHIGSPSPRILHLATHGFFFPDPKDTTHRQTFTDREPVFKISDNPLIRSGLIMAGGNLAWQTGKPLKPGMDDGILTAYEISQMNLSNTELVVLSACETGLGDIQGNEGVYGLQRAFKIAGAKYLIMSLWQVPDRQTSLLMTTFYKKWLTDKMPIPDAFRASQKELREAGLDPYQWAGFVLVE